MSLNLPPAVDLPEVSPVPVDEFELTPPPENPEAERFKIHLAVIQVGRDSNPDKILATIPELGYTPANFRAMIDLCKQASGINKNTYFYKMFGIEEQSFYNYRKGGRGMHYSLWQDFVSKVTQYLKQGIKR